MDESERKKLLDDITELQRTLGEDSDGDSSSNEESLHFNPNARGAEDESWNIPCCSYFNTNRNPSVASIEDALMLNRGYQKHLSEQFAEMEQQLEMIREKQRIAQEKFETAVKRRQRIPGAVRLQKARSYVVFGIPYFKSKDGFSQPANEDTKNKEMSRFLDTFTKPPKPWLSPELEALESAVMESSLQQALQPLMSRKEILYEKLERDLTPEEKDAIKEKIEGLEEEIKLTKAKLPHELFGGRDKKHDWLKISTIDFSGDRTPMECKLMWTNFLHPSINKAGWTIEELEQLNRLAEEHGNDWQTIAMLLNTNRTDYQCMEKYQCDLNPALLKSGWTADEDELLKEIVEACRVGDLIPWHQVTYYMEGRTSAQVARRWQYHLDPEIRKGQWTIEEDMLLLLLAQKYGPNYAKLKEYMHGRTDSQIRERYVNVLDKSVSYDCWTEEEDDTIVQLYRQIGPKWSDMAALFPQRTDGQIAKRLLRIKTNTEKEGYDFNEMYIRPRTLNSTKWRKYRDNVYVKLRRLIKTNERKLLKTKSSLKNDSDLLKRVNHNEILQMLLRQQTVQIQRPIRKCKRRGISTAPVDKALMNFFKMVGRQSHGRPFVDVPVEENDPVNKKVKSLYLQALGSKIDPENLTACRRISRPPKKNLELPFLPPTTTSLTGFKSLLMFRNRLKFLARQPSAKNETKQKRKACESHDDFDERIKLSENQDGDKNSTIAGYESVSETEQQDKPSTSGVTNTNTDDESFEAFLKTNAFRELSNRFVATFFWPALLATATPLPLQESEKISRPSKKRPSGNRNKRKQKKPWVAERMKAIAEKRWGNKPKPEAPKKKKEECSESNANKKRRGRPFGSKTKKRPEPTVQRRSVRISKTN